MNLSNYSIKLSVLITFTVVFFTVITGFIPQALATISVDFDLDEFSDLPGLDLLRGPQGPQAEQGPTPTLQTTKVEKTVIIPRDVPPVCGTASSECPEGTALTGGSYKPHDSVNIIEDCPSEDNRSWEVTGETNAVFADGHLTAIAECASLSSS